MQEKLLFLSKYLRALSNYDGGSLDIDEAMELAKNMLPKIDMHDCSQVTVDSGNSGIQNHYEFYVRIGSPQFRGTINYTLPSHSLFFSSKYPTNVLIMMSDESTSLFKKICLAQQENWESTLNRKYMTTPYLSQSIPVHPHVSNDGSPCLGGWSNAWASAVNSGQIPSLVNVCKSFLNTWTSNDAYWNINSDYREWRYFPPIFKKAVPFTKWLTQRTLWTELYNRNYDFTGNDQRMPRRRNFSEWIIANTGEITAIGQMYDFDDKWGIMLMDLFYGITLNQVTKSDTECGYFNIFKDFYKHLEHIFYVTQGKIASTLQVPDSIATNLAAEAMMGLPKAYQVKPWIRGTRTTIRCPLIQMNTIMMDARQLARQDSTSVRGAINVASLFDFKRSIDKGVASQEIKYLDKQEALKHTAFYLSRSDRMYNAYETLHNFAQLHGQEKTGFLRRDDHFDIAVNVETFIRGYVANGDVYDREGIEVDKYSEHYASVGVKNYTNVINDYNRRLGNVRDRHKSIIRDSYFGDDSEQNQLSAF